MDGKDESHSSAFSFFSCCEHLSLPNVKTPGTTQTPHSLLSFPPSLTQWLLPCVCLSQSRGLPGAVSELTFISCPVFDWHQFREHVPTMVAFLHSKPICPSHPTLLGSSPKSLPGLFQECGSASSHGISLELCGDQEG